MTPLDKSNRSVLNDDKRIKFGQKMHRIWLSQKTSGVQLQYLLHLFNFQMGI